MNRVTTCTLFAVLVCSLIILSCEMQSSPFDRKERPAFQKSFSHLRSLDCGLGELLYVPAITEIVNKQRSKLPRSHPLFCNDSLEKDDTVLAITQLNSNTPTKYYVVFTEGPSTDYGFYFVPVGFDNESLRLPGELLAIPADGFVYTAQRTDSTFTKRRKLQFNSNNFVEIKQPYYLAALKSKTITSITLFSSPDGHDVVAQVPKGDEVEVLLTDNVERANNEIAYLVRTSFGLVGWVRIPVTQYDAKVIEGISWWGD